MEAYTTLGGWMVSVAGGSYGPFGSQEGALAHGEYLLLRLESEEEAALEYYNNSDYGAGAIDAAEARE